VARSKNLLLIDGNSLFHRAYHALPPITDKSGEIANAVFGFSNMLLKAINEVKPDYIACAFDTAAPTFRHVKFEKYKAQRVEPPPDLYPQLPKVKKVLDAFGISYFEKEGFEADDILATISTAGQKAKHNIVILSGDKDILQLIDVNVKVQMPGWNLKETNLYGVKELKDKYGLAADQMVDFKSLMGDPSDNIPGISGVGPKTAGRLLKKYKTLDNIYKHVNDIEGNVKEKLVKGKKDAFKARWLVELDRKVDIKLEIPKLLFKPNWDTVRGEYQRLGFKSIEAKIPDTKKEVVIPNINKSESNQLELV